MATPITDAVREVVAREGRVVVMTGAGISAESGIPTFRGPEGYWTVGSREYRPEEMATFRMFTAQPDEVWQWYLYRRGICRAADPNPGHVAVVGMEERLGGRFLLLTQNVDGIHLRAGNSLERTYQIHGNIDSMRCGRDCHRDIYRIPESVEAKSKDEPLTDADREALRCPECGGVARPHVLWFDECYDEEHFRFESSIRAAAAADLLITVGTSGATNLPMQVGSLVQSRGALIIDVNPTPNPFSSMAESGGGFFAQGPSGEILPELLAAMA